MAGFLDIDLAGVEFMKMDLADPPDLSFHLFPSLPYELRLEIIEEWLRSRGDTYWTPGDLTRPRNPLAQYATINKQWKFAVEKHTFRSLTFVIPEFGRNTPPDRGDSFFRSSALMAYDNADALDDFQRICIEERINAVLELIISVSPHVNGGPRTYSRLNAMFSAAGHGDNNDQEVVQVKHIARAAFEKVLRTLERVQESKLKSVEIHSGFDGLRMAEPMLPTDSSLLLSQSLYAMTCRLEELILRHVINAPYFLAQSWATRGTTRDETPAWPKLRRLWVIDLVSLEPSDRTREAAELHDAVTQALPQMPNLTQLYVAKTVPGCLDINRQRCLIYISVWIETWPRDGQPAMRDGRLRIRGPAPEPDTIDLWRKIAQRQWDCNLEWGG